MTVRLIFWFFVGLFLKSTLHLYTPPSVDSNGFICSLAGFTSVFISALSPNTYGSDQSFGWAICFPRASILYIGPPSLSSLYQNTMMTVSSLVGGSISQGIWTLWPATALMSNIGTEKYRKATELSLQKIFFESYFKIRLVPYFAEKFLTPFFFARAHTHMHTHFTW